MKNIYFTVWLINCNEIVHNEKQYVFYGNNGQLNLGEKIEGIIDNGRFSYIE